MRAAGQGVRRRLRTLNARLVLTAVALVVAISLLVGGATALTMRAYLTDQLDQDVAAALARARTGPALSGSAPIAPLEPRRGDDLDPDHDGDVRGQGVGTVSAFFSSDSAAFGDVLSGTDSGRTARTALDDATLAVLADVPEGAVQRVDLPGLGSYRVSAALDRTGRRVVVGLPDHDVTDAVEALVKGEVVLILLGAVLAALAGHLVVRRQLRPLREVAETAHSVAGLPLSSGAIGVTERVPAHLTDPDTEVGQVGAALNTLLEHVETSLDARHTSEQRVRQFVADASHELRTPLTTIAGYTELARRRPDDPETSATALAKVEEESRRMTALVEDLLLLARLDSGRPLERRPVDLTRLLLEAVSDARVVDPSHRWRLELPDEVVEVEGDEHRLHQVVTNLLTNARKYTPPGTTVTVTAAGDGFTVHDDGPGFPPDLVPHAFERFARADAGRHREGGVGLGLALVDAIVSAHGGTVGLVSTPGSTRVEVRGLAAPEIV